MNALINRSVIRGALSALLLAAAAVTAQAGLKIGDTFPDLATQHLEGKLPASLKGKVVLVDFWASWCAPCAKSFPAMEELQKRYPDRVVILAVSVDEKASDMQAFLKKHPATFTVVRDAEHKLVAAVNAESMPTSFLVDAAGKVRFIHNGFHGEETRKQYLEEIESLLKGTP
ncbi:MAG: Redoxin domain protein [Pedosphaera sp.]|nr:Redoxin domain protein [Pedosphaera sp.]